MRIRKCPTCDQQRNEDEFYTHIYKGFRKPDFSSCKECRKIKAKEQAKIRNKQFKSCKSCERKFGKNLKHSSRGYCHSCYETIRGIKEGTCKNCNVVFGKGRSRFMSRGFCVRCYESWYRNQSVTNCKKCGEELDKPSVKGLCYICKDEKKMIAEQKMIEKGIISKKKSNSITKEDFEKIRRLLVKFKWGYYNLVDTYRVAEVYERLFGGGYGMDTKPVEVQLVIMIRRLKDAYERSKDEFNI